ncbi:hypothetical protein [Caldalkalibacillus mannanilyticus]|uniref:hypothetical protein n=1 Tax=Caldalkalibacillus mannanilyticus TaxID=1418 RepID=UPI000A8D489A|nr:hypothetical protein [Caldalkalibacillus mannanilyticus]
MVQPRMEIPRKICQCCKNEMVELFDSYTEQCPECNTDKKQLLVNSTGVWVWK